MRRTFIIATAFSPLGLAGCGGGGNANAGAAAGANPALPGPGQRPGEITVSTPQGTATIRSGSAAASGPAGLPPYPGADPSQTVNISGGPPGRAGQILSFRTGDTPQQVIAFYAPAVGRAGYTIANQMDTGQTAGPHRAARPGKPSTSSQPGPVPRPRSRSSSVPTLRTEDAHAHPRLSRLARRGRLRRRRAYVSIAEHPARLGLDDEAALAQWKPSYAKGRSCRPAWRLPAACSHSPPGGRAATGSWLIGGLASSPTGQSACWSSCPPTVGPRRCRTTRLAPETRALLQRWGRLHAVRTALGTASALIMLCALGWRL